MVRPFAALSLSLLAATAMWAAAPAPAAAPATAPAPKVGAPTLITLRYENAPAESVFRDLSTQIGREFTTYNDDMSGWPAVSVDAQREPYWQVIAKLEDTLRISTSLRRNGKIQVSRNSPQGGVRHVSGPCMLVATQVRHDANLTNVQFRDHCAIEVRLHVEPNLEIITYPGRVIPDEAVDERGNSLVPNAAAAAPSRSLVGGFPGSPSGPGPGIAGVEADIKAVRPDFANTFQIVLAPPANAGYRIARVKGIVRLQVIEKSTDIEIPAADFDKAHNFEYLGANVAIAAITNPNPSNAAQNYRVSLNVTRAGLSDDEWARVNGLLNAVVISLQDRDGFQYSSNGGGGGRGSSNRSLSSSFQQTGGPANANETPGPPAKCRIRLPEVFGDIPIPFEFVDLPLP